METIRNATIVQITALSAGQGLVALIGSGAGTVSKLPVTLAALDEAGRVSFWSEQGGRFVNPAGIAGFAGYARDV